MSEDALADAVLTLPFGSTDLSRTSFESSPMLNLLRGLAFDQPELPMSARDRRWVRDARRRLPAQARPVVELLSDEHGYIPSFLVPEIGHGSGRSHRSPDEELEALREVTDADIAYDLDCYGELFVPRRGSRIMHELRDRGSALVPLLTDALHAMYTAVLAADWPDLRRILDAEIAQRGRQLATDGTAAVLNDLHPRLSWRPDVLELQSSRPFELTFDLRGEGITFLPCLIGGDNVGALVVEPRRSLFAYPVRPSSLASTGNGADPAHARLAGLIGRGRAAALRAIGDGVTTTELAVVLHVGLPTASAHAAALRAAGLVVTERTGRSVRHRLTGLGADLLAANPC